MRVKAPFRIHYADRGSRWNVTIGGRTLFAVDCGAPEVGKEFLWDWKHYEIGKHWQPVARRLDA